MVDNAPPNGAADKGGPSSPLDDAPAVAEAPRPPRGGRKAFAAEAQGPVITTTRTVRPAPPPREPTRSAAEVEAEEQTPMTPFDLDAAIDEGGRIEVTRVGPGDGPGWRMKAYNGQQVHYARMGALLKGPMIYDEAQKRWGGGEYEFRGQGKDGKPRVTRMKFAGIPLPPDNVEEEEDEDYYGGFGQQQHAFSPFTIPGGAGMPDAQGYVAPVEEAASQQGVTGWVFMHAVNRWKWFGPGPQPGLPPALPGSQQQNNNRGFDPSIYDHRRERDDDPVMKALTKLLEKQDKPAADPMAGFAAMMQAQQAADRLRFERDSADSKLRWEKEREDRRDEMRKAEVRMMEDSKSRIEEARIKADADKAIALAHSEASKSEKAFMMEMFAKKADSGDMFSGLEKLSRITGQPLFGGAPPASEAAEMAKAVNDGLQTTFKGLGELVAMYRANGGGPGGGSSGGGLTQEQQATYSAMQLLGMILKCHAQGVSPEEMPRNIAVACETVGLDFTQTANKLKLASPEIIAAQLDGSIAGKNVSDAVKNQVASAKSVILSDGGRAWFEGVKRAITFATSPPSPPPPQISTAPSKN